MPARLLLIEDDASIARFVEMALEDLAEPVQVSIAASLAEARRALQAGGWQLVISDLMLPDGSAEALLTEGHASAPGAPAWLVFSAGLHDERLRRLAGLGVAHTLRKPVALSELLDTVASLLPAAAPEPVAPAEAAVAASDDPVQRHFGGDRALYDSFRAGCIARFGDDIAQGDAAVAAADAAALRRVAHGLKAVLELLGEPALAGQARALEDAAEAAAPGWPAGWPALAEGLRTLAARPPR